MRPTRWWLVRLILWGQITSVVLVALLMRFPYADPLWEMMVLTLAFACVCVALPALVPVLWHEPWGSARLALLMLTEIAVVIAMSMALLPGAL